MSNFYSVEELKKIGFKEIGENVLISRKASIYGAKDISIGNNVRIDDFCILSGKIEIGNYIHIAAYCAFYGGSVGIKMKNFSTTSSRCSIYAISDDYSGRTMTNPMIENKYKDVQEKKVIIGEHCVIGTNCTILPGVNIKDGCAFGAMSLINKNTEEWGIYVGIPIKRIKDRKRELLKFINEFNI